MRVLQIFIRQTKLVKKNYNYSFGLGDAYIAAAIKQNTAHELDQINLNHLDGEIENVLASILNRKRYSVVLLGATAFHYMTVKNIILYIKKHKSSPVVVLGGDIITTLPEYIYRAISPDIGVLGEGERTIVELLAALHNRQDLCLVKGLIFERQGELVMTPARPVIQDLDAIPFPDLGGFGYAEFLDNMHPNDFVVLSYFDTPRIYSILASRGCPYGCTFCYHYGNYRERTLANIKEEIYFAIKKYRINFLFFIDECLSYNKVRLTELCMFMQSLRKELSWDLRWMLNMTTQIDVATIKLLKESGVVIIGYGFESMNNCVLRSMRKPVTAKDNEQAFLNTLKNKVGIQAKFIFGDIAETAGSSKETLGWWEKHAEDQIRLSFVEPYPNSVLFQECIKRGVIKISELFFKKLNGVNWYNMTENMSDQQINSLKNRLRRASIKNREYAKTLSLKKEKKGIYTLTLQCPYCRSEQVYRNCSLANLFFYGFYLYCRKCSHRFYVATILKKIIQNNFIYPLLRNIIDRHMQLS